MQNMRPDTVYIKAYEAYLCLNCLRADISHPRARIQFVVSTGVKVDTTRKCMDTKCHLRRTNETTTDLHRFHVRGWEDPLM